MKILLFAEKKATVHRFKLLNILEFIKQESEKHTNNICENGDPSATCSGRTFTLLEKLDPIFYFLAT